MSRIGICMLMLAALAVGCDGNSGYRRMGAEGWRYGEAPFRAC